MPKVFLDTDVAFDILSKREPHFDTSVVLLHLAAKGIVELVLSEISLGNLVYLTFDIYKIKDGGVRLVELMKACTLVTTGKLVAEEALTSNFKDKEDALQYFTALHANAEYLVTRNTKDFKVDNSRLPVLAPIQFNKLFQEEI